MTPIQRGHRLTLPIVLAVACGGIPWTNAASTAAVEGGSALNPPAAKPWVMDNDCDWWLSSDDGHRLRASIGTGDNGLVLTMSNPVFLAWSEEDRPRVEIVFDGDMRRRVEVEGWSTHVPDTAMFGVEFDKEALGKLAGATRLDLRRDGKPILALLLMGTPGKAELEACIPRHDYPSDSE